MATNTKSLALRVSNFGPIAKAEIDLRPLTVFVGPSNTGKSYLAILIYALHQFFSENFEDFSFRRANMQFWDERQRTVSKDDISNIFAWVKETIAGLETAEPEKPDPIKLPESIAALVRSILNNAMHLSENLESEIARCFGVDKGKNLIRHPSDGRAKFSLRCNSSKAAGCNVSDGHEVMVIEQGAKLDVSIPNTLSLQVALKDTYLIENWITDWLVEAMNEGLRKLGPVEMTNRNVNWLFNRLDKKDDFAKRAVGDLLKTLAKDVVPNLIGPLSRPAYYLPADRAGVMHAHQVAVRGLIASASRVGLRRETPMPVLSGVLGDFLEQLVALASSSRLRPERDNVRAQDLERALLGGTVRVERSEIDYPSFVYRPTNWRRDLPLMNASSMVSELAPVVLYLRHVVQPGDVLIIEEPESHLHPAMQVEFIRQLAAVVRSGVRVMLTTHSEWVLEELANLVLLSKLPKARRKGIDDPDIALRPDQVGAWFFEPSSDPSGSVVREITLDTEAGTFPAGFGLVTESLYNRWVEIYNRSGEG